MDDDARLGFPALQKVFHLSSQGAAAALGINHSRLKRACQHLNIARWPHRKLSSLVMMRAAMLASGKHTSEEKEELGVKIDEKYQQVMLDPNHEFTTELFTLRHSLWKRKHCDKRREENQVLGQPRTCPVVTKRFSPDEDEDYVHEASAPHTRELAGGRDAHGGSGANKTSAWHKPRRAAPQSTIPDFKDASINSNLLVSPGARPLAPVPNLAAAKLQAPRAPEPWRQHAQVSGAVLSQVPVGVSRPHGLHSNDPSTEGPMPALGIQSLLTRMRAELQSSSRHLPRSDTQQQHQSHQQQQQPSLLPHQLQKQQQQQPRLSHQQHHQHHQDNTHHPQHPPNHHHQHTTPHHWKPGMSSQQKTIDPSTRHPSAHSIFATVHHPEPRPQLTSPSDWHQESAVDPQEVDLTHILTTGELGPELHQPKHLRVQRSVLGPDKEQQQEQHSLSSDHTGSMTLSGRADAHICGSVSEQPHQQPQHASLSPASLSNRSVRQVSELTHSTQLVGEPDAASSGQMSQGTDRVGTDQDHMDPVGCSPAATSSAQKRDARVIGSWPTPAAILVQNEQRAQRRKLMATCHLRCDSASDHSGAASEPNCL